MKNNVFANIVGVPFPFIGVDGSDACGQVYTADGKAKAPCPLKAGTEYLYKNNIDVLEIYPRVSKRNQPQGYIALQWSIVFPNMQL